MSNNYWNNREVKLRKRLLDTSIKQTEIQLAKEYKKAAEEIIQYMEKLYLEIMQNPDVLPSHVYQYNRYYEMLIKLEAEMQKLNSKECIILRKEFTNLYDRNIKIMNSAFPMISNVDTAVATDIINAYWVGDGKNWSDRIWADKTKLIERLRTGLMQSVSLGRAPDKLKAELMKDFGASYNNASRLVRTEMAHIQTQSTLNRYKEAGLTKYRVLTAGDDKVCQSCKDVENQPFLITEALTGINLPPLHPFVVAPFLEYWIIHRMVRILNNLIGD